MLDEKNGYDIIIPYDGIGNSLKTTLRAIDKHVPVKRLFLVTEATTSWITNVEIIRVPDKHKSNKDANLFDKVIETIKQGNVEGDFIFWSDDQAILSQYVPENTINKRNAHSISPATKWVKRLRKTVDFVNKETGVLLEKNYDSHCPQLMNAKKFLKIEEIDYQSGIGFTICTLYFGLFGSDYPVVKQEDVKVTVESYGSFKQSSLKGKRYLGFNASGYNAAGVREYLEKAFPKKSIYEK